MSDQKLWGFRIDDILHSIERIQSTLEGLDFIHYSENENAQDIIARHFQIIGEAARKIPDSVKESYPDLPWQKMVSLRNFVVHEYHNVDQKIIWDTAITKLPKIKDSLKKIRISNG